MWRQRRSQFISTCLVFIENSKKGLQNVDIRRPLLIVFLPSGVYVSVFLLLFCCISNF